ncbi:MAG: hypothetical protein U0800_21375 [Isosphaeraceae bacterium]
MRLPPLILLALAAAGCIGPRSLELTRLQYDQAVHETSEQQWLRNIVRVRYGELPSFLDVSAITSQFELSGRGGMTGGQERASPNLSLFGDLGLQLRDAPTLSYTPRDPSELTRAMVAPVGVTALGLMANNGWSIEDVLRLMIAEMNGVQNMPGAEALIPECAPAPTYFPEITRLAAQLRRERLIVLAAVEQAETVSPSIPAGRVDGSDLVQAASHNLEYRPADRADSLVLTRSEKRYLLTFAPASRGRPDADALRDLLHLSAGRLEYEIHRENAPGGLVLLPLPESLDKLEVRTRTLLEMLTVLSKGVELPGDHVCRGLAAQTIGPDGSLFDWTRTTEGLFRVCVARKKPKDASVAIEHLGYWYFIPASDKRSQATLGLLQALFNLQLNEPRRAGPLLTLPVGF